jgi:hypothetical protein
MNAKAPLDIVGLRGSWENVHPDVVYIPNGFGGYPFWMVFTPYPLMDDRFENPTIRASHDGLSWHQIAGVADPIVPGPTSSKMHNADPELVYNLGRLHLIYLTVQSESDKTSINDMSCDNDLCWTKPTTVFEETGLVSPTFSVQAGNWQLWFVRKNGLDEKEGCRIVYRKGSSLTSLGKEQPCTLDIAHHIPWHIDVQRVTEGFEALVAAFPSGTGNSRTRLFHAFSRDGINFVLTRKDPLIAPSRLGWDNQMVYRSSFLKDQHGNYSIWYSACSWSHHCGIGFLQGSLDALRESSAPSVSLPRLTARFPRDFAERLKQEAARRLPSSLIRTYVSANSKR